MIYFFIILLFIPVPLIIKVKYSNKLEFFIYNKKLTISKIKRKKKKKKKGDRTKYKNIKMFWKPYIKININLIYGFDDAAATAISYGIIFSLLPILKNIISKYFNIKKFYPNIKLDYKNKIFNLYIKCIIFINIAQIIVNLVYIIYFNLKRGVFYGKPSYRQSYEKHNGKP